jgi:hypothetical protein
MPLAEYNNMVKVFPPDRTDQPFSICVLPWRARRRRSITNAHGSNSSNKDFKPAVIVSVQKQPASDTVALTRKIETTLQDLQRTMMPAGITVTNVQFRQASSSRPRSTMSSESWSRPGSS